MDKNDTEIWSISYHASQCNEGALDLSMINILKQVIGFKDVSRSEPILCDCTDEVTNVFQL